MKSTDELVKRFVLDVLAAPGRPTPVAIPRVFRRLAAGAMRQSGGGRPEGPEAVGDLVNELWVTLLASTERRGGRKGLHDKLAAMDAAAVVGYVRTTLKHLAIQGAPDWDTVRALREAVQHALEDGLPPSASFPASLERGTRFHRGSVAAACRAALDERGAGEASPAELTALLMRRYRLGGVLVNSADAQRAAELAPAVIRTDRPVEVEEEARRVLDAFVEEQGDDGCRLLLGRELGFVHLAKRLGVAVATAHQRYRKVEHAFAAILRKMGWDLEVARVVVEGMRRRVGPEWG